MAIITVKPQEGLSKPMAEAQQIRAMALMNIIAQQFDVEVSSAIHMRTITNRFDMIALNGEHEVPTPIGDFTFTGARAEEARKAAIEIIRQAIIGQELGKDAEGNLTSLQPREDKLLKPNNADKFGDEQVVRIDLNEFENVSQKHVDGAIRAALSIRESMEVKAKAEEEKSARAV